MNSSGDDSADGVTLALTHDEALVLFEWLHTNAGMHVFSDQAAQPVLWDLEASLERRVTAVRPGLHPTPGGARSQLRDSQD